MSSVVRASWGVRLTWLSHLEWGSHYHRTRPEGEASQEEGGERTSLPTRCLHVVYMFLTMKCVLGNIFLIYKCITEECVRERPRHIRIPKKTAQPCIPICTQSSAHASDISAEGVEMWFCWYFQMQNRSLFPSVWLSLLSNRMEMPASKTCCQKHVWQTFQFLCIENKHFFQWALFRVHSL